MDRLHMEARASETAARRLARPPTNAGATMGSTFTLNPVTMASRGLGSVIDRARTGWSEAVADEVANLFTKGIDSPAELQATLNSLQETARRMKLHSFGLGLTPALAGRASGGVFRQVSGQQF